MTFSSKYNIDKSMFFTPPRSLNLPLNRVLRRTLTLSSMVAALHAMPVLANNNYAEVGKLTQGGQYSEALAKANAYLAKQPKDAQMRFLKGLILTEQNKSAEAISVFTKLTEDFPRSPEPYNNLAVLFAATNQYEKSRAALEMAISTNPTYATAHENLGDVYAKLASQAYDKALQLDTSNTAAKSKLILVRTLVNNTAPATAGALQKNTAAAAVVTKPAAAIVPPPVATIAKPAPSAPPEPPKERVNTAPITKAAPAIPPTPKKSESPATAVPSPAAKDNAEINSVLNTVNKWASAWSTQDIKGYLGAYSNDFQTPQGLSRKAWAEERRSRIEGKNRISIKIGSPKVTLNGDSATVKFRQSYKSNTFTSDSSKTLLMTKQGGKWQIKQERTGS